MVSRSRWTHAQEYEQSFWRNQAERIAQGEEGDLSWYNWRANRLRELLDGCVPDGSADGVLGSVLEVGSGPVGIVSFLGAREAVAVDPLSDFYGSQPALIAHRNPAVTFLRGGGEELPFPDARFDLVILDNVIDHVQDADGVMAEITRVLQPRGHLYFTVNLHPLWGYGLHRVLSRLYVDRGHPHTFSLPKVRRFLSVRGFRILHEQWEDYRENRKKDWAAPDRKSQIKAIAGLTEYLYTAIAQRV